MRNPAFLIAFAFLFLPGCATDHAMVDREVGAGQPQGYKDGYRSGCDSGYVAAGHPYYRFSKNVTRYRTDDLYKSGWDDGFAVCKGRYESF